MARVHDGHDTRAPCQCEGRHVESPADAGRSRLGEIEGGDVIVYGKNDDHRNAELEAARRLLSALTPEAQQQFSSLLEEFDARETADAKFANAIDRTEPLLQNIMNGGETWKKNGIAYQQIIDVNREKVSDGSRDLWAYLVGKIDLMRQQGVIS